MTKMWNGLLILLMITNMPMAGYIPRALAQDDLDAELDIGDDLDTPNESLDSSDMELETDEGDLDAEIDSAGDAAGDAVTDSPPPPESLEEDLNLGESAPEEPMGEPAQEPVAESPPDVPQSEPVTVTGVDFDGNQNGGTIVISATGPVSYTTRTNQDGSQFILELDNTRLPEKFKRPYDTKEFSSSIGFFQGYQGASATTARFVIQMRNGAQPNVSPDGNRLLISTGASVDLAQNEPAPEPEPMNEPAPPQDISMEAAPAPSGNWDDASALKTRTLDEFLLGNKQFYGHPISIEV
ncbi:MAG: AMIN domain-containing protein, partial [Bdellovibrionales bacterium]|nr:AMIN domain-containing protein [Bdellovibrionales bacterium]